MKPDRKCSIPDLVTRAEADPLRNSAVLLLLLGKAELDPERLVSSL
jgi:hypothetical protein